MGNLRWLTSGESHGPALVAILEGLPAGVRIGTEDLVAALGRRRGGYGRGARMGFERDEVEVLGGLRHGHTLGSPVSVRVGNTEWPKWRGVMSADPVDPDELEGLARAAPLTRPRPGHADLAGAQKYGFDEVRPVLERASARETAARVAIGEVARAFLRQGLGVEVLSHVVRIGDAGTPEGSVPGADDRDRIDADPVRCLDPDASAAMVAEIDAAKSEADTVGGVVEVVAHGLPPGLGSHVHADRKLDARIAAALTGVQAIKGVEFGDGFAVAARRGSEAHDEIERDPVGGVRRRTNRAGGVEGGMTTGDTLRVRAAKKPISSLPRSLDTLDIRTGRAEQAINQRSDTCAVPAAGVVAEAAVAFVLADAALEKFGGDSVTETTQNVESYLKSLAIR